MTGLPAADSAYFNAEVETMSRADLEALQLERLLRVIPIAYERAPLIRQAWEAARVHPRDIRTLDDWRNAFKTIATQDDTGAIKVAFDFR